MKSDDTNPRHAQLRYDLRVRERFIHNGVLTREQLSQHLATLPDLQDQCESVTVPQPGFEQDEEADENNADISTQN